MAIASLTLHIGASVACQLWLSPTHNLRWFAAMRPPLSLLPEPPGPHVMLLCRVAAGSDATAQQVIYHADKRRH